MTEEKRPSLRRRKTTWMPPTHAPRPFELWISDLIHGVRWKDSRPRIEWLITARTVAKEHGCRVVYDLSRDWTESVYITNYNGHGPVVCVGAVGSPIDVCSAFLHELGHHLLRIQDQHPKRTLPGELAAWEKANELAALYRLPLNARIRRTALYTYRYAQELEAAAGSKSRNRRRPQPHSWRLEDSRRSAAISTGVGLYSIGNKGKRHAKKFIKSSTVRAERRKPVEVDDSDA